MAVHLAFAQLLRSGAYFAPWLATAAAPAAAAPANTAPSKS